VTDLRKIGEVARRATIGVDTLRYYEKLGLLAPAGRTDSGYRLYDDDVFERISFIRKAQSIGFTLEEIGRIVADAAQGRTPCAEVRRMAASRLAELDDRLRELNRLRRDLRKTLDTWEREGERVGVVCGLIEGLHANGAKPQRRKR